MTKINVGEVFESMSGKYGKKHVLRNVAGKTVLSRRPKRSGKMSPDQLAHLSRFKEAVKYATFAKDDPILWKKYQDMAVPGNSAYNHALADFISVPTISELDTQDYTGQPGGKIIVTAVDKIEVISVTVRISRSDGTLIEEGPGQKRDKTSYYVYLATQDNPDLAGTVITAVVTDNPGHSVTAMVTL